MADNYSINKSKMNSFIRFVGAGLSKSGKTMIWDVMDKDESYVLGVVKWYGHWRGYAFFPAVEFETIYEQKCLREIAAFLERKTKLTRQRWRNRR